ncbi:MAG TPA: cation-transporting P-type ATPase, partial [Dongiaceae bacterium]|nr:cation-transporting P-type ATPase [Dongiaceae bacterium]
MTNTPTTKAFWSCGADQLAQDLSSGPDGLSADAAEAVLRRYGPNSVEDSSRLSTARLLLRQFESPLVIILVFGAGISLLLRDWTDAGIIFAIVLGS